MEKPARARETAPTRDLICQLTKRCSKCLEERPLDMFSKDKKCKDGLMARCRVCRAQANHAWREANREMVREADRARYAALEENEREKKREAARVWKEANRNKVQATNHAWKEANWEKRQEAARAWKEANRDKVRMMNRQWQRANKERRRESNRAWREANPEKAKKKNQVKRHRRRAQIEAIGGSFTTRDIEHIAVMQEGCCCYCSRRGQTLQIEHIIPVTREGSSNDVWNLALACWKCNCSKQDKLLEEWTDRWYLKGGI